MSTAVVHPDCNDANVEPRQQTVPMKAFNPSVLVTAATSNAAGEENKKSDGASTNGATGATKTPLITASPSSVKPSQQHVPEDRQLSPLKAFTSTHAAGTSASHENSRTGSPVTASLADIMNSSGSHSALVGIAAGAGCTPLALDYNETEVAQPSKQMKPLLPS